jgi:hypothetical protein
MTAKDLRAKRVANQIPGHAVCRRVGFGRTRLSDVECGNVTATPEELQRIDAAIEEIILTRQHLTELASKAGLSLTGVRL